MAREMGKKDKRKQWIIGSGIKQEILPKKEIPYILRDRVEKEDADVHQRYEREIKEERENV